MLGTPQTIFEPVSKIIDLIKESNKTANQFEVLFLNGKTNASKEEEKKYQYAYFLSIWKRIIVSVFLF
jgi:hypothetical protein